MEDLLAYLPRSTIVQYTKGQIVYNPERPPTGLYLVIGGKIKVSRLADNGDQVVVDIYHTDEFFGESALINVGYQAEQATVLDKAPLMTWTASEIENMVRMRPRLGLAILQMLVQRAVGFSQRIEIFSSGNIARRLAWSLIRFSERLGMPEDDGAVRMDPLTQQLLAEYVGTSREVLSQYMRQFQGQGYLRYSRKYIVVYPDAFKEWLRQNCP